MKKVKRSNNNTWLKAIGLVVLLLILIGTSVGVTLMAIGTVEVEVAKKNGKPVGDIYAAEKICHARIRLDHGETLNSINLDERSGRYDKTGGQYQLFYQLNIYRDKTKRTGVTVFYSNCYISSADGFVTRMEYLEHGEGGSDVSKRDDTNSIGL